MEKVQQMYNKAKLQFVSLVILLVALLALLVFPFLKVDFFGDSVIKASFGDLSGLVNLIVLIGTILAIVFNLYIANIAVKNLPDKKQKMMNTLLSALVGVGGFVLIVLVTLLNKEDGVDFDLGFYIAALTYAAVGAMNGYKAYAQKGLATEVMNDMKKDVQKKMEDMNKSNNNAASTPAATTETKEESSTDTTKTA